MISILNIFTILNLTLLGGLLFFKKNNNIATKILGIVIFIPATPFAYNYLLYIGLVNKYPLLSFICFNFLWAPFVLWYVLLMIGVEVKMNFKKALHLIPYLIYFSFFSILLLQDDAYIQQFLYGVFHGNYPWQWMALNGLLLIQCACYLIYGYLRIRTYIRNYEKSASKEQLITKKIKWVKVFVEILLALNLSAIVIVSIVKWEDAVYIYSPLLYDVAFYVVIFTAIRSSTLFSADELQNDKTEEKIDKEKYANSYIKPEQLEECSRKLTEHFINKKPYLNPKFSLEELSNQTNLSQHLISQSINQKFNNNFFDFINLYRVEEVKIRLQNNNQSKLSIEGIGLECGFGSPASFYRAFKKHTGFTPSQFIKQPQFSFFKQKTTLTL